MTDPAAPHPEDPDAAAREQALDPRHSVVLEAPAGSGKTTVLTERMLRLLSIVDEPEQILAITFTRKAAGEMRERVVRALRGDIDASAPQGRRLGELADAAKERSRRLGWSLEANPGRLRIQTIDSLNRWLAAQLPITARSAGDLAIADSPTRLYRIAARRTLLDAESDASLRADAELLFERLDNDFGRFEQLLTAMLQARAHWLPKLLRGEARGQSPDGSALEIDLCARVEQGLRVIVSAGVREAGNLVPGALIEQGARLAREAARHRLAAAEARPGPWQVWAPGSDSAGRLELRHWQALAQLALTAQATWRVTLTKREGFPPEDQPLKEEALRWIASLSRVAGVRERLAELAALPDPQVPVEDARALSALARLLRLAASELELTFQEHGRVDYPYVAAAARRALTEEGAPTDLALRLGTDIRHILVDEFQDTSIEQAALLQALTCGWEEGDGRTLFAVGDPMQSIYQFREAEVGLFLRASTHGIGALRLLPVALTRNFRSAPALVAWLNATFARCFPQADDPRTSAVRYRECTAGRSDLHGFVRLHATPGGEPETEARAVAQLAARLRAEEPRASVAILLASRSHAPPIVAALRDARIAVAGVDLVSLADLPVVRDLEALTRALDHLADRTAWLAVLRAPWCGLTLSELSLLIEGAAERTVWEAINDETRVQRLSPGSLARLVRTRAVLARALARRDRAEPAAWVEAVWLQLGGPAACGEDEDLEQARTFFAGLARWSSEPDWSGPLELEERLERLYAMHPGVPAGAVQIMTIHRAKGLEFDKVIVPALGRRLRSSPEPLLRWLELPAEREGSDLLMAAIPSSSERGSELSEYLKRLQAERAAHERVRLVYVAATRARSELHLFGELPASEARRVEAASDTRRAEPAPASGTLLAALWCAIAAEFLREPIAGAEAGAAAQPAPGAALVGLPPGTTPDGIGASRSARLARLAPDWRLPEVPAGPGSRGIAVGAYDSSEEEIPALQPPLAAAQAVCDQLKRWARRGRLPTQGQGAARALRERLARLGFTDNGLDECTQQAVTLLDACLTDSRLQWIFASTHERAESPLRLTGIHEGHLTSAVIDRTFVDSEGVRWLIDFRADSSPPSSAENADSPHLAAGQEHDTGLAKRIALARALGPEPARAGIYFPAAQRFYAQP
jgi:ATP-dependent helicase/nuclease subunit A